ncbi:hypothetical protein [Streptomyces sp. NPDC044948]|uniref:hypothetical protein n=1 Tax=Streptomyces sp. NPDC044948 TaxID=3157092 RepID=UPI0033C8A588
MNRAAATAPDTPAETGTTGTTAARCPASAENAGPAPESAGPRPHGGLASRAGAWAELLRLPS